MCATGAGLRPYQGRGAPEIDLLELQLPHISQSYQVAPIDPRWRLGGEGSLPAGSLELLPRGGTALNSYRGDEVKQTLSANTPAAPHAPWFEQDGGVIIGTEYQPRQYRPDGSVARGGYISWYLGGELTWHMTDGALAPDAATPVGQRLIPEEPMAIVIELAASKLWTPALRLGSMALPASFDVEYVRVYQPADNVQVGCLGSHSPRTRRSILCTLLALTCELVCCRSDAARQHTRHANILRATRSRTRTRRLCAGPIRRHTCRHERRRVIL